jgi:hypothetical protein
MDAAQDRARFDWLVEIVGASALALAVGFAGLKAAPSIGAGTAAAMLAAGLAFGLGALGIRAVPVGSRDHVLPPFALAPIEPEELLLDCPAGELLLDTPLEEPLLLQHVLEDGVLLLDDPLVESDPGSRVVRLFAAPPMPTPGQLRERIEQHLATGAMHVVREFEGPAPDASDALYAALSDLRRSLR